MKKKMRTVLLLILVFVMAMPVTTHAYTGWRRSKTGNYYYYNSKGVLQRNRWIGQRYVNRNARWDKSRSYVEVSKYGKKLKQLITVEAKGSRATITLHEKNSRGQWYIKRTMSGYVGRNGVGKRREGDLKTPSGMFTMSKAFGINKNPGTALSYRRVNSSYYWVTDPSSRYYNKFVTTRKVRRDWSEAERIVDYKTAYRYVLSVDYNKKCVPGKGSAIFLHCSTGGPTAGCISVSYSNMKRIMRWVRPGARIAIGTSPSLKRLLRR